MSDPREDQEEDLDLSLDNDNQGLEDEKAPQGKKEAGAKPAPAAAAAAQSDRPASDSRFFAIRTTGGQERMVADMLYTKVTAKKIGIRSVLVLDSFKGYIIVEAPDANVAYEGLAGIRHVRGQIRGDLPFKDIEGYLIKKPTVTELNIDDTVEVIAGPFKGMKAKITRVDYEKQEATVVLLDSPYQIPVTVDANYLKKIAH
ncbi:MAG TPA: transcription elongation factor Spt5 [Nitrososphaera sp.]